MMLSDMASAGCELCLLQLLLKYSCQIFLLSLYLGRVSSSLGNVKICTESKINCFFPPLTFQLYAPDTNGLEETWIYKIPAPVVM